MPRVDCYFCKQRISLGTILRVLRCQQPPSWSGSETDERQFQCFKLSQYSIYRPASSVLWGTFDAGFGTARQTKRWTVDWTSTSLRSVNWRHTKLRAVGMETVKRNVLLHQICILVQSREWWCFMTWCTYGHTFQRLLRRYLAKRLNTRTTLYIERRSKLMGINHI